MTFFVGSAKFIASKKFAVFANQIFTIGRNDAENGVRVGNLVDNAIDFGFPQFLVTKDGRVKLVRFPNRRAETTGLRLSKDFVGIDGFSKNE